MIVMVVESVMMTSGFIEDMDGMMFWFKNSTLCAMGLVSFSLRGTVVAISDR